MTDHHPMFWLVVTALAAASPAAAEWKAANPEVTAAAKEPHIAAALAAVERIDQAVTTGDHAGFAALLADDLVVNNPQNRVSDAGTVARRNAEGWISYSRYRRTIEYAGVRGGQVVLMGEELVVPRLPNPLAGQTVRRRFTDIWRQDGDGFRLALRQATIIPAEPGPQPPRSTRR